MSPSLLTATPALEAAERGWVPDPLLRFAIRRMLAERAGSRAGVPEREAATRRFVAELSRGPIALVPEQPNEQHYDVPASFFEHVLGPRLKYSCGHFRGTQRLDVAERQMLRLTCARAALEDGMEVLDLGCGWGSLSLWIAEQYPRSRVLAVSNAKRQREHILLQCERHGLANVEVLTADINDFDPGRRFQRVISVEMFEHMRNWPLLLARIASWLAPDGRLFVHHFSHRAHCYPYVSEGAGNWMARHFFTGGMMPSHDLLGRFGDDLCVERRWRVSGLHYKRTCDAWLANLDAAREAVSPILAHTYGAADAARWLQRWRLFFLACSELFGYRGGGEWFVTHARLAATSQR